MIRKISDNQNNSAIHHLENNDGAKITEKVDILNTWAQEISKNSSSNNYSTKFQNYQEEGGKEHRNLIMTTLKTTCTVYH